MFLDKASRDRLRKTAERTEQLPPPAFGTDQLDPLRVTAAYQGLVKITGARVEPGYYPGVVTILDRTTEDFVDRADVTVWVRTLDFGTLDNGSVYWGRAEGPQLVGAETRALYLTPGCCTGTWECQPVPGFTPTYFGCSSLPDGGATVYGVTVAEVITGTGICPLHTFDWRMGQAGTGLPCTWTSSAAGGVNPGSSTEVRLDRVGGLWQLAFGGTIAVYTTAASWDGVSPLVLALASTAACTGWSSSRTVFPVS